MNTVSMPRAALDAAMDAGFCEDLFGTLRAATFDGVGITRESFGAGESTALDIVEASARKLAQELGCQSVEKLQAVTKASDVIITVVTDDKAMKKIYNGGLLSRAKGKLCVQCGPCPFAA